MSRLDSSATRTCSGVGRSAGFFAMHAATSARSSGSSRPRSGSSRSTRYNSVATCWFSPNGGVPAAANASTAPSENTSLDGLAAWPCACSGERYPGEPTNRPVRVSCTAASNARVMPKSISRGPSRASNTFDGFTSRCTSPSPCTALSASANPAPSARTEAGGNGPNSRTAACNEGPATYPVATHGCGPSVSASNTGAVHRPPTRRAAATSCRNRARNSGSAA